MAARTAYLVTGGAGFIGSHLVRSLLAAGKHVRVLDDFSTGRRGNLDGQAAELEIVEGDLRDAQRVREAVAGVEVVFHEAAFVSVPQSMDEPQRCLDINVNGTAILLNAARVAGVRRVVIASSAAVYGDATTLPQRETAEAAPRSPYALSKLVDEVYARFFSGNLGLEVTALRYFNVYGSRQRPDSMYAAAVPIFVGRLLAGERPTIFGDGGQTRDLIHVHDVVRANMIAADHAAAAGEVFNICTGQETRVLDILHTLAEILPGAGPAERASARPGDIYRSVGDPALAAERLGFRSEITLAEGLGEVVEWMRTN